MNYAVEWKSLLGGWFPLDRRFLFFRSARRFAGRRVATPGYAAEWRVKDRDDRVVMHLARVTDRVESR